MSSKGLKIIIITLLLTLIYSIARYHIFEAVPLSDFPLYVFNKAISLAGFILLTINFGLGPAKNLGADVPDSWLAARKELGIVSFMLILAHMVISLLTFGSGGYYAKFFDTVIINAIGGWSMLFGVLAIVWLWLYNISFKTRKEDDQAILELISSKASLLTAGFLAAGHVTVMGYQSWLTPGAWAGGLPPITLVAFAAFLIGLVLVLRGK